MVTDGIQLRFTILTSVDKLSISPIMLLDELQGLAMANTYPWDYHSDLTAERLTIVAQLIADGRQVAIELFDEEAGDNGWTLGCRAFQFGRARILRTAESGKHPWLDVIDRSLQLIFKIGEVPVRIYRGDADEPTDRTMRQSFNELKQLGLLFDERDEGHSLVYRFAIETDFDGSVLAVKFVGLRGKAAVLNWDVPLDLAASAAGTVGRAATESIELTAPLVGVRGIGDQNRDGDVG